MQPQAAKVFENVILFVVIRLKVAKLTQVSPDDVFVIPMLPAHLRSDSHVP